MNAQEWMVDAKIENLRQNLHEEIAQLEKRIEELEEKNSKLNPPTQVQSSGPQCKKCGAFTTKKRVETHGLRMKCEEESK